jgi:hypothetical protein
MSYTLQEILKMSPATLRRTLTHEMAIDKKLSGKIEAEVAFEPRWSRMNAIQYTMVALAWAFLEGDFPEQKYEITMRELEGLLR